MKLLFREKGAEFRVEILAEPAVQDFIGTHASVLDSVLLRRIVINLCLLYKKLTFADKNELRWKRTRISNWRNAFCPKR